MIKRQTRGRGDAVTWRIGLRVSVSPCLRVILFAVLALLTACQFKATFPGDKLASSLQEICSRDYKLAIRARHSGKSLQVVVLKKDLFTSDTADLQSINRDAMRSLEQVLLSSTRIVLSTDAALDFIEVRLMDAVTGARVSLWRYVPDIQSSMYQRFGDMEYFSRLLIEVETEKTSEQWDAPITLSEFLAKQIVMRAKRESADSLIAHADLTNPSTLGVVIENWPSIEEVGPDHAAKITGIVHKSAEKVIKGYKFNGFQSLVLRDARGVALRRWAF